MVANICLITCALFTAQPADRSEWQLAPRVTTGQELVYRGTFAEEAVGRGVEFKRSYRLDSRVFVLEAGSRGLNVALYTTLKLRSDQADRGEEREPSSVRLELAKIDLQGRVSAEPGVSLFVPLEGPATVECGAFVECPRGAIKMKQTWEVLEGNRPARVWKVTGVETVSGSRCLKLEAVQQSADWDHPRADRGAWRRRDIVWLAPDLGIANKVERIIEHREPAQTDVSQRSVAQYELQSSLRYPGRLFEDRRREILQASKFFESVAPMLPNPTKYGPQPFQFVGERIARHLENNPPTPYREAILQVKRRIEAAQRGEAPPMLVQDNDADILTFGIGHKAPDFAVTNLLTRDTAHLNRWQGKPLVLVFYSPKSFTAHEVLQFAQRLQDDNERRVNVVSCAFADDVEAVRRQREQLHVSLPVLSGKGLKQAYAVEATPKLVVVDGSGIIRGSYVGWGPETPDAVRDELRLWLPRETQPKSER
jgi:peroxiredoxin